ncbi:hypothetical protein HMPREF3198_00265 [Winkia neuii]|nr:hypothetical protein HMPREF3198_00265 [Winkia neuii]
MFVAPTPSNAAQDLGRWHAGFYHAPRLRERGISKKGEDGQAYFEWSAAVGAFGDY